MCCDIGEYALKIEVFFKRSFKKRQNCSIHKPEDFK